MTPIDNYRDLLNQINDSIESGLDTYIFGYSPDYDFDHWYDDEDEDTENYYTCCDLHRIQDILFANWIGEKDAPVVIVFDYYKEPIGDDDWLRIGRLHIFWTN